MTGMLTEKMMKKEALGGGDVKFAAMIGAFLGWQGMLWTIMAASVTGVIAGLWTRLARGQEYFAYGPHLALGAFLYLFWQCAQ